MVRFRGVVWALMLVALTGCSALPLGGDAVENARPEPLGPGVEFARFEAVAGGVLVERLVTETGPCARFRFVPHAQGEPVEHEQCLATSGIDGDRPVTGRPDTGSVEGINASAWWAGSMHDGLEYLHWGLVHPSIAEVRIVDLDGSVLAIQDVVRDPLSAGLAVFAMASPPGARRYWLIGYREDGCVVEADRFDAEGGRGEAPGAGATNC